MTILTHEKEFWLAGNYGELVHQRSQESQDDNNMSPLILKRVNCARFDLGLRILKISAETRLGIGYSGLDLNL